jgi:hypothetical protein
MAFRIGDGGKAVGDFTDFLNRKFPSYSNIKRDDKYGLDEARVVAEAMRRYGLPPTFMDIAINGVMTRVEGAVATDEFLQRAAYRPPSKPIIFTVEGHLADMFVGPCAFTAQELERQGVIKHQPVGYDNVRLPFNNQSGVDELLRLLNSTTMPDGYPFPEDKDWGLIIFSQGGIVGSKVWLDHLRPAAPGTRLAKRRDHLKRVVAFGNPYRETDKVAPWVPDPPKPGTHGISDVRITDTPPFWMEHSRHGDLYAEIGDDEAGLNCTAIYKIVSESSWVGGPAGMLTRVIDLLGNPFDGFIDIARAIIQGIMFAANAGPHGIYDLGPCVEWMRGVAA